MNAPMPQPPKPLLRRHVVTVNVEHDVKTVVLGHTTEVAEGMLTIALLAGGAELMAPLRWPIVIFAKGGWASVQIDMPTPAEIQQYYDELGEYVKACVAASGLAEQTAPTKTRLH